MTEPSPIVEPLRNRLRETTLARGQLTRAAETTGIAKSALSRFLSGERSLPAASLDRLAVYLDMELKPKRGQRRG